MKARSMYRFLGVFLTFFVLVSLYRLKMYRLKDDCSEYAKPLFPLTARTAHVHPPQASQDVCEGSWVDKYKYYHNYSLSVSDSRSRTRFLVYWCGGRWHGCGGFGNRMHGLISVFYLAMITNRVFLIHWEGPERFEEFFQPNQIDWTYRRRYFRGKRRYKRYWGVYGPPPGFDISRIESEKTFWSMVSETTSFDVVLSHQVEKIGSIRYFAEQLRENPFLKKRWHDLGLPMVTESFSLIGCAFNFLFKLSPYMERELQTAKSRLKLTHPMIGVHIRTSDLHWGDSNIKSVRTRSVKRVLECCKQIEYILQRKLNSTNTIKWFLAADDFDLKTKWLKLFPGKVSTNDAIPKHIEFEPSRSTMTSLLVDLFLLKDSDFLVGTRDSSFTNTAIGLGRLKSEDWVYGEYCDEIKNKINNDHDYVYNKDFIKNLHPNRFPNSSR